jgi:leucyl/phenylalanyl-tRNA--protein transferase
VIPLLGAGDPFPPLTRALKHPNGLLAAGADLSLPRLLQAYRSGIFPWFSQGDPIMWWSPDPRMVLFPAEVKVARSLAKTLRNRDYEIRTDCAFTAVMAACAGPRRGDGTNGTNSNNGTGTWITDAMRDAYFRLHQAGYAHSVEVWVEGALQGGLYGVAIGRMFYGESMFSLSRDLSKIALVYLARQLARWDFAMIDCQMNTAHLASMGAREIPRVEFWNRLQELVDSVPDCAPGNAANGAPGWQFELGAIRAEFSGN